jgi:hypothetical protein
VIVWAESQANLLELEALARKVAATAHLKSGGVNEPIWDFVRGSTRLSAEAAPLFPPSGSSPSGPLRAIESSATLADFPTNTAIMNWNDAARTLESILTKVLAQAQASRLIEKTMAERGVKDGDDFDIDLYGQVGRDLMNKIPHKVLRNSLLKEFEAHLAKIS